MPDRARSDSSSTRTLWYTRCPVPTATGIAIEQGFFDREFAADGIQVRSLRAARDRATRESHFDHRQADSFRQGGNIPPIWSFARNPDTRLIGLTSVDEYQAIVARPESGIRNPADLRGRKVGIPRRVNDQIDFFASMCLRGLDSALKLGGLSRADVQVVDLPVVETYIGDTEVSGSGQLWSGGHRARRQQVDAFALIRGDVDAIHCSGAAGLWLRDFLGAHDVIEFGSHPDPEICGNNQQPAALTVSARLLDERPDLVDRYLAQVVSAAQWGATHRTPALQSFANEVGTSLEWAEVAYGPHANEKLVPSLAEPLTRALESQRRFLRANGFVASDFDIEDWIDRGPLARLGLA